MIAPFQSSLGACTNGFVIKLGSNGTPVYSTYLGGQANSSALAIGADAAGAAYIAGSAGSGFPTVNAIQSTTQDQSIFVSKFNVSGSALVYSSYLGEGNASTSPSYLTVDSSGEAYIAGTLDSSVGSVPISFPIQSSPGTGSFLSASCESNCSDGFVSVVNSAGTALSFSTYLGGSNDSVSGIGVDSLGNIYIAGTAVGPFPILNAPDEVLFPLVNIHGSAQLQASQLYMLQISRTTQNWLSYPSTADLRPDSVCCAVGTTSQRPFNLLLANANSSGSIGISNITVQGDFSESNTCPATLVAGSNCQVQVMFSPTAAGERTGTITVTDSAPGSPHVINLIGNGLAPQLTLNPSLLSFAAQAVGSTSQPQTVTVTNSGGASLTISNISVSGDFSESNNCSAQIGPSGSCSISIEFTPSTTGDRTGKLIIADNAPGAPHSLNLSGSGASPNLGLAVAPGSSAVATVTAGNTASYQLAVGGEGVSGTASIVCTGAPQGATCTVPGTEPVSASTRTAFSVNVSTTPETTAALIAQPMFLSALAIFVVGLPSVCVLPKPSRKKYLHPLPMVLIFLVASCGGNGTQHKSSGTPAGSYRILVTATVGSTSETVTLTLNVQ